MRVDGKGVLWYSFDDLLKELPEDVAQACWEDVVIYRMDDAGTPQLLDFASGARFDDWRHTGGWDEYVCQAIFDHLVRLGKKIQREADDAPYRR